MLQIIFMELSAIKEKLHTLIDTSSDDELLEIYEYLENRADGAEYTDEFKAELDAEYEDYVKNENGIPAEEVFLAIDQILGRNK